MERMDGPIRVTAEEMDRVRREAMVLRSQVMRQFGGWIVARVTEAAKRLASNDAERLQQDEPDFASRA